MSSRFRLTAVLLAVVGAMSLPSAVAGQLALPSPVASQMPPTVAEKVSRSIVRICSHFTFVLSAPLQVPFQKRSEACGTGIILDADGHIATDNHVVNIDVIRTEVAQQELNKGKVENFVFSYTVEIPDQPPAGAPLVPSYDNGHWNPNVVSSGNYLLFDADPLISSSEHDIAILTARIDIFTAYQHGMRVNGRPISAPLIVPEFEDHPPSVGDQVSVSGYPMAANVSPRGYSPVPYIPNLITDTGTIEDAKHKQIVQFGDTGFVYYAKMHVSPGNSGGPVFNSSTGKILGLVDATFPGTSGKTSDHASIIPIEQVFALLSSYK